MKAFTKKLIIAALSLGLILNSAASLADLASPSSLEQKKSNLIFANIIAHLISGNEQVQGENQGNIQQPGGQDFLSLLNLGIGSGESKFATADCEYYIKSHRNDVIARIDLNGSQLSSNKYSPYGSLDQALPEKLDEGFTGQRRDSFTNLDDFYARPYSSGIGRFLTPDPKLTSNRYAYCSGDPINRIDPDGMDDLCIYDSLGKIGLGFKLVAEHYYDNSLDAGEIMRNADNADQGVQAIINEIYRLYGQGVEFDRVGLLDHASKGKQTLGDKTLTTEQLAQFIPLIKSGGTLNIMGCKFAGGKKGYQAMIDLTKHSDRKITILASTGINWLQAVQYDDGETIADFTRFGHEIRLYYTPSQPLSFVMTPQVRAYKLIQRFLNINGDRWWIKHEEELNELANDGSR